VCRFFYINTASASQQYNQKQKDAKVNIWNYIMSIIVVIILIIIFIMFAYGMIVKNEQNTIDYEVINKIKENDPYILAEACLIYIEKQIFSIDSNPIKGVFFQDITDDNFKFKMMNHNDLLVYLKTNTKKTASIVNMIPLDIIEYCYVFILRSDIIKYRKLIDDSKNQADSNKKKQGA
jgi:hypothetical protein